MCITMHVKKTTTRETSKKNNKIIYKNYINKHFQDNHIRNKHFKAKYPKPLPKHTFTKQLCIKRVRLTNYLITTKYI